MKNILVIEDDENISNMLCDLLKQNEYLPTAAYSGTEAIMRFNNENYDLILLDLMIPGKSGNDVLLEIRTKSNLLIIALTAIDNKESIVSLLKSGANDYITKPFDNDELLARIEVQLRNNIPSSDQLVKFKNITLDQEQYDAFIETQPLQLSKREYEILSLYEFMGDDNTINVHISKIRAKIAKVKPHEEYIQTVWGIGFKMQE